MKVRMIAAILAATILASPAMAQKKNKHEPSALELQQLQSRDIEASKDVTFGAVMSVLQDAGYRILSADKDTGLITGISSTKSKLTYNLFTGFGKSKKSPIVSAFIESRGPNLTNVRLSFVMAKVKSTLYGSQAQDEAPIYDAVTYQSAFEKVNQAVFIRQSMLAQTPPSTASSTPTTPSAVATTAAPNETAAATPK
jgi:formylmethanofuran dehydrogenase subunit E-like metal-binding protein